VVLCLQLPPLPWMSLAFMKRLNPRKPAASKARPSHHHPGRRPMIIGIVINDAHWRIARRRRKSKNAFQILGGLARVRRPSRKRGAHLADGPNRMSIGSFDTMSPIFARSFPPRSAPPCVFSSLPRERADSRGSRPACTSGLPPPCRWPAMRPFFEPIWPFANCPK